MRISRARQGHARGAAGFTILALLAASGCNDDGPSAPQPAEYDFTTILSHAADGVIVPTYADLESKAATLLAAVTTLRDNPTPANLLAARQAWRDARRPWEMSEGFLFGPVDTQGIDPAIDSWPVNQTDLDAVLASGTPLTSGFIDGLEGTLKGFHTTEYLLFGENGDAQLGDFTPRIFEYLLACSQSLVTSTATLHAAWSPSAGDFAAHLRDAGAPGSVYSTQRAAVQELVNGMMGIADEVANGKINDPFTTRDLTLEESRFSANSKADFADNIRSIQNIYLGRFAQDGAGIADFVRARDAALDTRFEAEIATAIAAIEAIPGTFSTAVFDQRAAIETAQQAVLRLSQTLGEDVLPLVVPQ